MLSPKQKKWTSLLVATPLHPQWLLRFGPKKRDLLSQAHGLILDVGCADRWPEKLLPESCRYMALDYPPTGGTLYSSQPDVFADAASLPFVDNSFDTVLFFEVLEHVAKPRRTLIEISRVLKPGGLLIMSMPFLYPMHDEPHDYQRYTLHGLTRELKASGLQLRESKPSLSSAETAGLLASLALSGMALQAARGRSPAVVLLPIISLAIPSINILAWLFSKLLPSWPAMTAGHTAIAVKP